MSSGPQWAADREESERIEERFQAIMVSLAKLGATRRYDLVSRFDFIKRDLNDLKDIRLSRVEHLAFQNILQFLKDVGV